MVYKKVDLEKVRARAANIRLLVLDVDGVMTDGRLQYDADGRECKVFNVKDGYGIRRVIEAGIEVAIISGRQSIPVQTRADELGIRHVYLGKGTKLPVLEELLAQLQLDLSAVAYVGDDLPDAPCIEAAGLGVAVADAHAELDAIVDWHTHNGGGAGAVREVCDLLLSARTTD